MRLRKNVLCGLLAAAMCSTLVLNGCSSGEKPLSGENGTEAEEEQDKTGGAADGSGEGNLGDFAMKDLNDETYTQEMFADYDLTMVNVFTTWCTPCVREIPDLEKIYQEMKDDGVGVAGIVLDAADGSGETDSETVEKAKMLAEKTGVSYPFLIPDEGYLNGRLAGIQAVPETFFVDRDGNIVGETYSGSRSFEDWKSIIEKELEGVTR